MRAVRRALARAGMAGALALAACGDGVGLPAGAWVPGAWPFEARRHGLGAFEVRFEGSGWHDARLLVFHRDRPDAPVWETLPGRAFLSAGRGRERLVARDGRLAVEDAVQEACPDQSVDVVEAESFALRMAGRVRCPVLDRGWELFAVPVGRDALRLHVRLDDPSFDRTVLTFAREPEERFAGFGQQSGRRDPAGGRVPILVQRPAPAAPSDWLGTLRGLWPGRMPAAASPAPVPYFLTSRLRSFFLESSEYAVFDLRRTDRVRVEVFAGGLTWRVLHGGSALDLVRAHTEAAGRAPPLPDWADRGVIAGVRGGTGRVQAVWQALRAHGVPVAAFAVADWAGGRPGLWRPDPERYAGWDGLVSELSRAGIRVLLPVSPVLGSPPEGAPGRPLFDEARASGFLVRDASGAPLAVPGASEAAGLVDLSDPDAAAWWTRVLADVLRDTGAAGWLAEPGPAPPWDAGLAAEGGAPAFHNAFADAWSRVARASLEAAGLAEAGLVLPSLAFAQSPRHASAFGAGVPAPDPDPDADRARVRALLSGGVSGLSVVHAPAGGDTPARWRRRVELAAFGTLLRTEPGLPLDDAATLDHLARMARVHAAWRGYRRELLRQAAERGAPVWRPLWMHHPEHVASWRPEAAQLLVGSELLVVPILDPESEAVEIFLPAGRWIDLWSGTIYGLPDRAQHYDLPVPADHPIVLYPEGSIVGHRLHRTLTSDEGDGSHS